MPNLTFDFTGRTAIVTGAARGIGLELARHLHHAGAAVFLLDFDAEEVDLAARDLGAGAVACDVTSTESVEEAVRQAVAETGRLDIVVNNAGVLRDRMLWKLSDDEWDAVMAVHVGGTYRTTRAATP